MYKDTIKLKIGGNEVTITPGNIFEQDAWRVIAVDTHFSTNVDDVEISPYMLTDYIYEMGKKYNIAVPYATFCYHAIKALEEKNDGKFDYE